MAKNPTPTPATPTAIDAGEIVRLAAAAGLPASVAADVIRAEQSMPDAIRRIEEAVTARTAAAGRAAQIRAYVKQGAEAVDFHLPPGRGIADSLTQTMLDSRLTAREVGHIMAVLTGIIDSLPQHQIDGSLSPDDMTGQQSPAAIQRGWRSAFKQAKDAVANTLRGGASTSGSK